MKNLIPNLNDYKNLIDSEKSEQFKIYCEMLINYNKMYNLTAITDEKEIYQKHFLDSILGAHFFKENASVAEIGSGAGFPSMPLKIIRPDLKFTLIESVGKKCAFLRALVERLGITDVNILNIRAEDGAKMPDLREKFDHCTARAVARMDTLSEYCIPFVKKGGTFIAYKGDAADEVLSAQGAIRKLGGNLQHCVEYDLSGYTDEVSHRTLVVVQKTKPTPPQYPRGNGQERKKPLC